MSLAGAKFICLDEAGENGRVIEAKGRKFTVGYYMACDYVLDDSRAMGVHCEIQCDAFGRVIINNLSKQHPVSLNGLPITIKRPLLNGAVIEILDRKFLWKFPKTTSVEYEDVSTDVSTPQKQIGIPEQPPNSCPDFKLHRDLPKRLTVHNFAYCIESDEEGNTSTEVDEIEKPTSSTDVHKNHQGIEQSDLKHQAPDTTTDLTSNKVGRAVTPDPAKATPLVDIEYTPKMNLINSTQNKENTSSQKKQKLLSMCNQSDIVITSFSPRETGVRIEKSFTAIVKAAATTPKSVYGTPKGALSTWNDDDSPDFIDFSTPASSKKCLSRLVKKSSMHLIDLTTPGKLRFESTLAKSAQKNSAVNARLLAEKLGVSAQPATPTADDTTTRTPSSAGSVISVDSTDSSSVIEVSESSTPGLETKKIISRAATDSVLSKVTTTPKRTPQSLMKRALLTSAKKQQYAATHLRTPQLRLPVAISPAIAVCSASKPPLTPTSVSARDRLLKHRLSLTTPTRKGTAAAKLKLDDFLPSPEGASTSLAAARHSSFSLTPPGGVSTHTLPSSTPLGMTTSKLRAGAKTSPLHRVRKFIAVGSESSQISKVRTRISPSRSAQLLAKARRALCSPVKNRRSSVTMSILKTLKSTQQASMIELPKKAVLFVDERQEKSAKDELNRTFTLCSDDEVEGGNTRAKLKNQTTSLIESVAVNVTRKEGTLTPTKETKNLEKFDKTFSPIPQKVDVEELPEVPVDVCEVKVEVQYSSTDLPCVQELYGKDSETKSNGEYSMKQKLPRNMKEAEVISESFGEILEEAIVPEKVYDAGDVAEKVSKELVQKEFELELSLENNETIGNEVKTNVLQDMVGQLEVGEEEGDGLENIDLEKLRKEQKLELASKNSEAKEESRMDKIAGPTMEHLEAKTALATTKQYEEDTVKYGVEMEIRTEPNESAQVFGEPKGIHSVNEFKGSKEVDLCYELKEDSPSKTEVIEQKESFAVELSASNGSFHKKSNSAKLSDERETKDTAELLDEIEYVLNKSDELQKKQLLECEVLHERVDIEVSHENQTEESVVLETAAEEHAISNDSEDKDKINEGNDYSQSKNVEQSSKPLEITLESISIDVRDVSKNTNISEEIPSDFKDNSENKNDKPFSNDIDSTFKSIATDVQDNSDNKSEVELSIAIPSNFTDIKNEDQSSKAVDFNSKAIPTKSKDNSDHKNEEKSSESIPSDLKDNSENKIIDSTFESIQNDAQDNSDKKNEVELSEVITADSTIITVNKNEENPSNVMYSNYKDIATDSIDPAIHVDVKKTYVRSPLVKQQIENCGKNESETPSFSGLRDAKTPRCTGLHDPKTCQNDKVQNLEGVSSLFETPKHVNVKECQQQEPSSSTNTERHIFTPRRSERRASLSTNEGIEKETWSSNKPEPQVFTPRRSARRASMSSDPVDSNNLYTPKRKTRRASLSVEATTMLTLKRITTRRPSMPLDNDVISATPQRKTPRPKRIALIEENAEDIEAIAEEETEVLKEDVDKEADELFKNEMHVEVGPTISAINEGVAEKNSECDKEVNKLVTPGDEDLFGEININTASSRSNERVPISHEMAKVTTEKAHKAHLKEVSIERKMPLEHKADEVTSSTNHEVELIVKEVKRVVTKCGEDQSTLPAKEGTFVTTTKLADDAKEGMEVSPETSLIEESICEEIEHEEAENYKCIERKEHLDGDKNAMTCLTDKTESAIREIEILEDDFCEIIEDSNASSDNVNTVVEFQALQPDESVAENSDEFEYDYGREVVDSKGTRVDHIAPANLPSKSEIATQKTAKSIKVKTLSPKTPVLVGMRELLKTPKALAGTPEFTGLYELVRTPKSIKPSESTTNETLDQLTTPVKTPKGDIKALEDVEEAEESEEDEQNTTAAAENFICMREMLKTPKSSSTPLFKGLKELMQTPKICVTPIYGGIKELMNTPVNESVDMQISSSFTEKSAIKHYMSANISTCSAACDGDNDVGKFFTTPRAKNVMIPNVPPSAIIQKSSESVEYVNPTECTLNDTSIYKLDDIFKTQIITGFSENLTDLLKEESVEKIISGTKSPIGDSVEAEELEAAHLSAEESFDKLAGKEPNYRPPLRKMYSYKPPSHSVPPSPFSASDVISDLPKTDIQEWVDSLGKVESLADEFEDSLRRTEEQEMILGDSMINKSPHDKDPFSISALRQSTSTCDAYNETIGSEAMVNISAVSSAIDPLAASVLKKGIDKIPGIQLLGTVKEIKHVRPITPKDHDISGLDFLDQSGEGSVLSEPLVVSDTESNDIQDGQINDEAEVETSGSNELNQVSEDDEKNRCEVDFEKRGNDDFEASLLVSETDSLEKTEYKESEEDLKKKSAELLLEKSAELLEEESAEKLTVGPPLKEENRKLLRKESAGALIVESAELLEEKSSENLRKPVDLLEEESTKALTVEPEKELKEQSVEVVAMEPTDILNEEFTELLNEESAEALMTKHAELPEEVYAQTRRVKTSEVSKEESVKVLTVEPVQLQNEESSEALTVESVKQLEKETEKELKSESVEVLNDESTEILMVEPAEIRKEESAEVLIVEPVELLEEVSAENTASIAHENEGIASLTKSTGNIQMVIETEEQLMNEEKEHMLDTEISTAVKLAGLATRPEFEHFKANEIKYQSRSVTPHQHKERSKLSRKTLGAQEDLKITIDFQEEKLKLQTAVKEDLYENVIVNESGTCNIDNTESTNMNPTIHLQQSETEILSTSTESAVTNQSVNANTVASMEAQQKSSVANDNKEELPNDQTHLKTTEHTTEIKSSFISSSQGDKIQIPQESSVDATVSVALVPNRRGRGRKGSQSSQGSSNGEDPPTRRMLRKNAKTPIKESLEDVEIAKTKKESSEVFKSIDFEVEITDTIARNEIKDELEENVRESEKTIEGSAEATDEYVALATSEDVLIPVVTENEETVSSADNVEVDIQTHGHATREKRAGLHKTEMPTVVIKDTEQLFHENPATKTQRKRTVSETSQGSLKDEVRPKRRAGRRRKVNTIEEDEQKKLELPETHEVFEKVLQEEGTHTAKESKFPNATTGKEPISADKVSQEVLDGISHIASKVQQDESYMTKELELPSDKTDTAPKSSQEILDVELKGEDDPEVHQEETHISKESELSSDITKSNEAHTTRLKELETEAIREMPKRRSIHRIKTTSESSQNSVSQDNGVPKRRSRPHHGVNSHEENVSLEVSETAVQSDKDKDSTKVPARGRRHQKNMEEHEAETAVDDTKKTANSRRKRGRKNTADSVEKLAVTDILSEAADAAPEEAEICLQSEMEVPPVQPITQGVPEKSVKTEPKRRAARGRGKIEPAQPKTKHQEGHVDDNTDAVETAATEINMEKKPAVRRRAAQAAVQECQDEVATTSTRRAGLRRHIEGHNADEAAKRHNKEIDHGKSKYPVTADDDIGILEKSKFDEEHEEEEQKEKTAKVRAPSRRGGARKKKEEPEANKAEKETLSETINTEEERDHLKNADTKPEIAELKGRKRKESHTDHEVDEHSDEPAKKRATKRAAQAVTEEKTSTPSVVVGAAAPRRTRKASALNVDNSTTEIVALTVTPQQKSARNQPRRAAAAQPHYYEESSDNEMHHKTQRFQHQIDMSVTDAASTSATRGGRTRKPTAKVQQFLEEERAKTSTPKRRGLLNVEVPASPLKSSARRVRKPSANNDEALGTPIIAATSNSSTRRARGRALPAEQVAVENHTSVVEHKTGDDEPHDSDANDKQHVTIDSTGGHTASRSHTRGARKAKLEQHAADTTREAEEPPSKKALKLLVAEKMSVEVTAEAPQPKERAARSKRAPTVKDANVEKADGTLDLEEEKPKTTTTRRRAGTRAKAQQDEPQESSESVEAHIEAVVIVEHAAEPEEEEASLMKAAEKVGAKPKRTRRKQPEKTVDGAAELGAVSSATKTPRGGRAGRKVVRFEPSDETLNVGATVSTMADTADKASPATDTKGEADVAAAPPAPKRATRTRRK